MNKKVFSVLSGTIFLTLLCTGFAVAQEFAADMVSRTGNETINAKISVSQDKVRLEMPDMTMIIRNDKKVSWMLIQAEKMYMEYPIDPSRAPKGVSRNFDNEIERVSLGPETIDGQETEKFQVTYTENGATASAYQWLKDGQFPVKAEAVDGSWSTEYKNISMAAQPASLFEPPEGYQKMEMPNMGDMMNNMMNE